MTRRIRTSAAAVACLLALTSCGSDAPGEQAPELAQELAAIDDALAQEEYAEAQEHLANLVDAAEDARDAGELDDGDADRVLAAATRLLAALPGAPEETEPTPEATPEPSPSESATAAPPDEDEDADEGDQDEGQGNDDKDKDEKEDKGKGKGKSEGKGKGKDG